MSSWASRRTSLRLYTPPERCQAGGGRRLPAIQCAEMHEFAITESVVDNPSLSVLQVSATRGDGLDAWYACLRGRMAA